MRRLNIAYTFGCVALAVFALQSCNRTENLDNLNVITKPYALHFADTSGEVYSTYDGQRFDVFGISDNIAVQALATSGNNVYMIKEAGAVLFRDDAGVGKHRNFNLVKSVPALNPFAFGPSQILNVPGYVDTGDGGKKDRVYVAADKGLRYMDYRPNIDSTFIKVSDTGLGSVTSLTRLENGEVVAFDNVSRLVYVKADLGTEWHSRSSKGLPAAGVQNMYIISQKNDILAVVVAGDPAVNGIYRSTDDGYNFSKLPALPNGITDISCAAAPFGKVLIACTYNSGIWRLSGQGTWELASVGLKHNISVYAIAAKDNIFKNEKSGEYVFVGTNDGLYRSDDLGQTWVKLDVPHIPGLAPIITALY